MSINYTTWPGLEVFAWNDALVSRVLGYVTLVVEFAAPLLVWIRRLRVPSLIALALLHLGMSVVLEGVMMFNVTMLVALVVFLPSRATRRYISRLRRFLR